MDKATKRIIRWQKHLMKSHTVIQCQCHCCFWPHAFDCMHLICFLKVLDPRVKTLQQLFIYLLLNRFLKDIGDIKAYCTFFTSIKRYENKQNHYVDIRWYSINILQ